MTAVIIMSFDGVLIRHVLRELKVLEGGKVQKIHQLPDFTFLFTIQARGTKTLLLSASKHSARMHLTRQRYRKPEEPPLFCKLLRKHLESARLKGVEQLDNDRVVTFTFLTRDRYGERVERRLIVELFGKDANVILCDENRRIFDALNHVHPFEGGRTLVAGAHYEYPLDERQNPFENGAQARLESIRGEHPRDYLQAFQGVSPMLISEYLHRRRTIEDPETFFGLLHEQRYEIRSDGKVRFAPYEITHAGGRLRRFESPSEMLDAAFEEQARRAQENQLAKQLRTFIKQRLERAKNKIDALADDLRKTEERDTLRKKGELILANYHRIGKGDRTLVAEDYETGETLEIALEPTKTPIENSEAYFRRAKKLKKSIPHIQRQIKYAKRERAYFELLEDQLTRADLDDLAEIREELIEEGYWKQARSNRKKQRATKTARHLVYYDPEGIEIHVGKNNVQNARITHELARPHHVWFHVKDAPGAHVIVRQGFPLSETTLRTAAQLASYHSRMRHSSSVPVDYTEVKNLKKIPGQKPGFVTYKNQKTLFIDPDEDYIASLKQK